MTVVLASPAGDDVDSRGSTLRTQEEERLFDRFLAGDNTAGMMLYQRHHQRIFTYCVKMVGALEQAEDLSQEAWRRLIELRSSGRKLQNPIGFLMRVARNLCFDHLKARRRLAPFDSLDESAHPSYSMHEPSEMEEIVVQSLAKLSFDYREVLVLNIYCGYSFEEIAGMLGKSPESIWTRASRARAKLRTMVRASHGENGAITQEKGKRA